MLASPSTRRPESIDDLVPPRLTAALDQLDLRSARLFAGKLQGERRSKARGRSVEFEDYRQYVPGDDLRHVDWNVLARVDRLFIKIFQEEQDLALHLVIDASPSMDAGTPSKLALAQKLAMALGYVGLVNNNRVLVTIFGGAASNGAGGVRRLEPVRSARNIQRLGNFLLDNTFEPSGASSGGAAASPDARPASGDFTRAMKALAGAPARGGGRGVLVLLSDLLIPDGYRDGINALASMTAGWDITLAQILAPGELDPMRETDGAGRPIVLGDLRLTDAETGRACEVTVTRELVDGYMRRLESYQGALHAFATARGMNHSVVPSDADLSALMLGAWRRQGLLK